MIIALEATRIKPSDLDPIRLRGLALDMERLVAIPGIGEKTAEKALAVARWTLAKHQAETAASTEVHITPEMEKDEAAQAVASIEHPEAMAEAGAGAEALDLGPPPEAVELEEQFDPDVVPSHLGTPVAPDEEATDTGEERKEESE